MRIARSASFRIQREEPRWVTAVTHFPRIEIILWRDLLIFRRVGSL
jgi:hypothetical protein